MRAILSMATSDNMHFACMFRFLRLNKRTILMPSDVGLMHSRNYSYPHWTYLPYPYQTCLQDFPIIHSQPRHGIAVLKLKTTPPYRFYATFPTFGVRH